MFNMGMPELLAILAIVIVLFGAKKLPQQGSGLGKGIKNFKQGLKGSETETLEDKADDQ